MDSLTVGLALRKAICHALDREIMNTIIRCGEYSITNHPIYTKLGILCNPDIIVYDYNLEKAEYYMSLAGYETINTITLKLSVYSIWGLAISSIFCLSTIFVFVKFVLLDERKNRRIKRKKQQNA